MKALQALKGLMSWRGKSSTPVVNERAVYTDIHGNVIENGDHYFYRPEVVGFPVFKTEHILSKHAQMIQRIKDYSTIGDHRVSNGKPKLDVLFTDVIHNYAEYIHMLPASSAHHHSTPGGLIYHSLEASLIALREAQKVPPESSGFIDVDGQMKIIHHYAAWLLALVHDCGKIFTDIVVYPLTVLDPKSNRIVNASDFGEAVPIWQPQLESIISWARRFSVATYQVEFVRDRTHNKHNTSSASIIDRILTTEAKEFILKSPRGRELMAEFPRILGSYEEARSQIATAVRAGDMLSTARDKHIYFDIARGEVKKAVDARIVDCMLLARRDWKFNSLDAHAWIINKEVFLRWPKAFESILEVASTESVNIPMNVQLVSAIMRDRSIIEPLGKTHTSCKFTEGVFRPSDIMKIRNGELTPKWLEVVKLAWSGFAFGSSPLPNSQVGLIYLADDDAYLLTHKDGEIVEYRFNEDGDLIDKGGTIVIAGAPESSSAIEHKANVPPQQGDPESSDGKGAKQKSAPTKKSMSELITGKRRKRANPGDIDRLTQTEPVNDAAKQSEATKNKPQQQNKGPQESHDATKEAQEPQGSTSTSKAALRAAEEQIEPNEKLSPGVELSAGALSLFNLGVKVSSIDGGYFVVADELQEKLEVSTADAGAWLKKGKLLKLNLAASGRLTTTVNGQKYFELTTLVGEELVAAQDAGDASSSASSESNAPAKPNVPAQPSTSTEPDTSGKESSPQVSEPASKGKGKGKAPAKKQKPRKTQGKVPRFAETMPTPDTPEPNDGDDEPQSSSETSAPSVRDEEDSSPGKQITELQPEGDSDIAVRLARARKCTLGHMLYTVIREGFPEGKLGLDADSMISIPIGDVSKFIKEKEIRMYRKAEDFRILARVAETLPELQEAWFYDYSTEVMKLPIKYCFEVDILND